MVWPGMYAFGNGPHSPPFVSMFRVRPESDCDVESSRACYRSCSVVNELSPRCQPVNKIPKSKIHNPTSPLLLFANLHTLKRLSADNPSRPPLSFFSPSSFAFLAISCFLSFSSSTYLSHTLRTSEVKQWKLQQTLRLRAPRTCRNNK